ncbi:MAG: hypothetical protein RL235_609 [Chlamydiota bacterium]|jgi:hypothetical protein
MASESVRWRVQYSNKAKKSILRLTIKVKLQLDLLAKEIEVAGPYRTNWPHYGHLKTAQGVPKNAYHCHIKSGRSTYVVCWRVEDKQQKMVEIYYVGTHEDAPY